MSFEQIHKNAYQQIAIDSAAALSVSKAKEGTKILREITSGGLNPWK